MMFGSCAGCLAGEEAAVRIRIRMEAESSCVPGISSMLQPSHNAITSCTIPSLIIVLFSPLSQRVDMPMTMMNMEKESQESTTSNHDTYLVRPHSAERARKGVPTSPVEQSSASIPQQRAFAANMHMHVVSQR
ncbi:hypothetical protein PMIN03_003846 [Paraphaeosphaeria minitans]